MNRRPHSTPPDPRLQWARQRANWEEVTCEAAAAPYAGRRLGWGVPLAAARNGQLNLLIELKGLGYGLRHTQLVYSAAEGGHTAVLQWLRENGCPWDARACAAAAEGGHLGALQWLRMNGCPWDTWTCGLAAYYGHLEVLKWARQHGCPWDEGTCEGAADGGHLEVLQWARQHGCPWNEGTCEAAADGGHLEVLRWATQHGCPCNADCG